eukprot:COSAG01_NODE_65014_length_274_cov_1.177143_1_plen_23_part_10
MHSVLIGTIYIYVCAGTGARQF